MEPVGQAQRFFVVSFSGLAGCAEVAVLVNCTTELGPPIPSVDIVCCLLCSQMSKCLMCLSNDHGNDHVALSFCVGYAEDLLSISIISVYEVIPQLKCGMVLWVGPYLQQHWVCLVPCNYGCLEPFTILKLPTDSSRLGLSLKFLIGLSSLLLSVGSHLFHLSPSSSLSSLSAHSVCLGCFSHIVITFRHSSCHLL